MSVPSGREAGSCSGCGATLTTNARYCGRCGLPAGAAGPDPIAVDEPGSAPSPPLLERSTSTSGRAHRDGVPEWLTVVAGLAAVLSIWFVLSRPSGETEADGASAPTAGDVAGPIQTDNGGDDPTGPDRMDTTLPTTPRSTSAPASLNRGDTPPGDRDRALAPLTDLDAKDWRLLVGDGLTIVEINLGTGVQTRHHRVGAPLAIVDGRLLLYREARLVWSSVDDLDQPETEVMEVPTLQRMLTRGRSADRPVVIDDGADTAIWWPNNNANPQTWTKVRLADGTVIDSIVLTETVYGGPEVVATVGSGTFERVDGRWVTVGDLFASSASPQAIVGQQCAQPDVCDWVLLRRGETPTTAERLAIPVGGPFDVRLVVDADRILLLQAGGVTDYRTGRFIPMVAADAATLTAVNRSGLLAMADGANLGLGSSSVTVVNLDGPPDRSVARIAIDDLVPRWLVLVPPSTR